MLFHTRPNLPYRGLSKDALVAGIKIIRGIAKTGTGTQTKTKPNAT
jgi:hypothetical protein